MRILLVHPAAPTGGGRDLYSARVLGPLFTFQPLGRMSLGLPLALPTVAAHTPPGHEVRIVDEEVEDIDFGAPVDLVGLTAMTFKVARAYEIAAAFRRRGVKVVLGGIHATLCPDEAQERVDAVAVGEAEELWPRIVHDAAAGRLASRYEASAVPDVKASLVPRYDLVRNRRYLYTYLQTTRGCPYDCTFCTVTKVNGRRLRRKTTGQVVAELDAVLRLSPRRPFRVIDAADGRTKPVVATVAFIDDNFAIDREHALAVCAALRRYQEERGVLVLWYTQVNVGVGFDEDLLRALRDANCQHLFVGFESLEQGALEAYRKRMNSPSRFAEAIANIRRHGMRVIYSTILGDDHTSGESASRLEAFLREHEVLHVLLNVLTPYPGTALAEGLRAEGRVFSDDPALYNIRNVVFRPRNLSPAELEGIYVRLVERLFGFDESLARGRSLLLDQRFALPRLERLAGAVGMAATALALALRGRLRWGVAARLARQAPGLLWRQGSVAAMELLATSADHDDFARSELRRLAARAGPAYLVQA